MKRVIAFLGLAGLFLRGRAQTFAEWFEQKKTQIRYLKEQIAALESYEQVVQQGYVIDGQGLLAIGATRQADLDLHRGYFESLKMVNPVVRADPRVDKIMDIVWVIEDVLGRMEAAAGGRPRMKMITDDLYVGILNECIKNLGLMRMLLANGELQLTDKERLQQLGKVYSRVKALYWIAVDAWRGIISYSKKIDHANHSRDDLAFDGDNAGQGAVL
jgi:hypothetical protein